MGGGVVEEKKNGGSKLKRRGRQWSCAKEGSGAGGRGGNKNFRNATRWFLFKKFTVDSTCPCICSQKPIAASGFSHLGDYGFSPIHRRRSVMKKDVTCFKLLPKAGHDVSSRAEIKTLHHTKLRSLYKSRYEARIKDNKNLFKLTFFLK